MAQKFMTYEQQLNKLQADKGLTIPDADFARKTLEEISYYSLSADIKIYSCIRHPKSINMALPSTRLLLFTILMNNSAAFS